MKRLIPFTILLSAVLLAVCLAGQDLKSFQQKRAEALKLVDKYTQALDSTASFIEHYEETGEFRGYFPPNHPYYPYYGGKRFRYHISRRGVRKFKENKGSYHSEYAWGYFSEEEKNIPKDKPRLRVWISNMDIHYFHQGRPGVVKWERKTKETVGLPIKPGISHMLGYVASEERLDASLRKASHISLREKTENIRGSDCFVIDAHTRYGQFSVWLDPEHGYHAAKIRRRAKAGEYFNRPDRKVQTGSVYTEYLDVLEFKKVDDIWVPVDANAGYHRTIGSPAYYRDEDVRYKRTQIVLNPDHDKLASFMDPIFEDPNSDPGLVNGTLLRIHTKARPIYYTWQDGRIFDDKGKAVDMDELKERLEAQPLGR